MQLADQIAVVTGASSGIGAAAARRLAAEGASVALVGRDGDRLAVVADELEAAGGRTLKIAADIVDGDAPERIVEATRAELGPIDVLVHSAGIYRRGPFGELPLADLDLQWAVNARAPYALTRAALPDLLGGGRVVFLGSRAGQVGLAERAAYGASKAAVQVMVEALAVELAERGVRINGVAPGFVATPMNASLRTDPAMTEFLLSMIPAGRLGTPEQIADAILFLVSDAAAYVHGHMLNVDGGYPSTPAAPPS